MWLSLASASSWGWIWMTREEQGLWGERKGGKREGGEDVEGEEQSHPMLLGGACGVSPIRASPVLVPVEAAEDVEPAFLPTVQVQAQDGREDEQHHGKVEHHNHRSLQAGGHMSERGLAIPSCPPRRGTLALPGGRRRAEQGWAPGLP